MYSAELDRLQIIIEHNYSICIDLVLILLYFILSYCSIHCIGNNKYSTVLYILTMCCLIKYAVNIYFISVILKCVFNFILCKILHAILFGVYKRHPPLR